MVLVLEFISTCWASMMPPPVRAVTPEGSLHKVVHSQTDGKVKVKCYGELLVEVGMVLNLQSRLVGFGY